MTPVAATVKTAAAFAIFRQKHGLRAVKLVPKNDDELIGMTQDVESWVDGPASATPGDVPDLPQKPDGLRLWVVRPDDVVHADENSSFGRTLQTGVLKHTNLTGGAKAHCGGELVFLGNDVIAVTGSSGRYGPDTSDEMSDVAKAFKDSGYGVWNYGYDTELNVPFRFGARLPDWVS